MKKSVYNISFPYKENLFILFNSFSNATALLDDNVDELSYVLLANSKSVFQSKLNLFRILATTRCNANCAYCYEDKRNLCDMSEDTTNAVVEFIKGQATSTKKFNINIR